jgi:hypothetical protein
MKAKKLPLIFALVLSGAVLAYGQTAADMESLLDAAEVSFSQAAYFTLLATAPGSPPENPEAAFALARDNGWIPAEAEGSVAVSMSGLSLLMMKAFGLEGGLMYRLFPGGRYAYRAMTSRGFIEGRSYPSSGVSGEQFLRILGKVLAERGTE